MERFNCPCFERNLIKLRVGGYLKNRMDFDSDIFTAASNGKLSSVVYLLSQGTFVNSMNSSVKS